MKNFIRRLLIFFFLSFSSLPGAVFAQVTLDAQQIREFLIGKTVFAQLQGENVSWNAYFSTNGRVFYWYSSKKVDFGTWRISGNEICVKLDSTQCRHLVLQKDGKLAWTVSGTERVSSIFNRVQNGDVFGLVDKPKGGVFEQGIVINGKFTSLPDQAKWVQVHSFLDLRKAHDFARDYERAGFSYASVAYARNGWYAVVLGILQPSEHNLLSTWKSERLIPDDSGLSSGRSYYRVDEVRTTRRALATSISKPRQCSAKKYETLQEKCFIVFSAEFACSNVLSGELGEISGRSTGSSAICSAAAQELVNGEIDWVASGISITAGVADDIAESLYAEGDLGSMLLGALFQIGSYGALGTGLAWCFSEVDRVCGR